MFVETTFGVFVQSGLGAFSHLFTAGALRDSLTPRLCLKSRKYHPRQWVDVLGPAYKLHKDHFLKCPQR